MSELVSELIEAEQEAGGVLEHDSQGRLRVAYFNSQSGENWEDEVQAAQTGHAIFDLSDRFQIQILGADRKKFLHSFCTNQVKQLEPGQGCEAFVPNLKSKVLGHVIISNRENDLWIDFSAKNEQSLLTHLDRYIISDDVELISQSEQRTNFLICGINESPLSHDPLPYHLHQQTTVESEWGELIIRNVDWLGRTGYLVSVLSEQAISFWKNQKDKTNATPAGWRAFETLRIENSFPDYGRDITEKHLVQEVDRNTQCISFTKGCYLGQEPIARLDAMGHVNKSLRLFRLPNVAIDLLEQLPSCDLFLTGASSTGASSTGAANSVKSEKPQGQITSIARASSGSGSVALGYLRTEFQKPNIELALKKDTEKSAGDDANLFCHVFLVDKS